MKKNLTLLAALALGVGALTASSVTGCELIASVDHSLLEGAGGMGGGGPTVGGAGGTGGQGGVGGTTTSSGGGGTGGCAGPADCEDTEPTNDCIEPSCDANTCGSTTLADGTPIASQAVGDCKETQCAEMGANTLVVNLDSDTFDDGKECTTDTCDMGNPVHTATPNVACTQNGGAICNVAGECVECLDTNGCTGTDLCQMGMCVPNTCANGLPDAMETDVDCGGPDCNACDDLLDCVIDSDCQSLVCMALICQAPSCTDDMTNGTETDLNCGGTCPDCDTGDTCETGADCTSEVCSGMPLTCQAPVCGDGVTNAAEVCDAGDLDGETCASQNFAGGGTLSCQAGCLAFNTSGCNECDANVDCVMPTAPVCDVVAGNCEICVGASVAACGANESCNGNNDCACGATTSPMGPACGGTQNPNCNIGVGCFCAAAGAACGTGETCTALGCVCGPITNAVGAACGGGAATCNGTVCDCNGAAAGGVCGARESCEGGQCDCGPTTGAAGAQACPDNSGNPECFPAVGCRCGDAGLTCGTGETCSAPVAGNCTCGGDSSPAGEACPDADEYRVCNVGVGCACEAGSCSNGFTCNVASGQCGCDLSADCTNGGTCNVATGECTCAGAATPCTIPGQICDGANTCDCAGGSCED